MIESPLLPHHKNYIDGNWVDGQGLKKTVDRNPATGEVLAEIQQASPSDATAAIEAAHRSLSGAQASLAVRKTWLAGLHGALQDNRDELARIITLEQGKPLREAKVEVDYAAAFFRFFAENLAHLEPRPVLVPNHPDRWSVHYRPAGVATLITPWNFPLAMFGKKLAAALAAGCGIVAKPASQTPLTAIAIHKLAEDVGVPPGRVNLVIGQGGTLGEVFCAHPLVRVISCTGSTETGKELLRLAAGHVKRTALELGGNAPFIVLDDADLEAAADALMANKFRCAGQTCVCTNRLFVHEAVRDAFREKLTERLSKLAVGNGMDPRTDIGPLIDRTAFEKVEELVADALAKGAIRTFGEKPKRPENDWGAFYPPTLLEGVDEEMLMMHEEIFGPVVAMATFTSDEEVLRRANATEYGLAGYIFSRDRDRAERVIEHLQCGHVGLNSGSGPAPDAPFGGMKQSGIGREGGLEGFSEYIEIQTVAERAANKM
jgi:succinate-semialdehyde dehydrogenase/glutarate-semialdehyde dehydrogenase